LFLPGFGLGCCAQVDRFIIISRQGKGDALLDEAAIAAEKAPLSLKL